MNYFALFGLQESFIVWMGHEDSAGCPRPPGHSPSCGPNPTHALCSHTMKVKSGVLVRRALLDLPNVSQPGFASCFFLLLPKHQAGCPSEVIHQSALPKASFMANDTCLGVPGLRVFQGNSLPWLKKTVPGLSCSETRHPPVQ